MKKNKNINEESAKAMLEFQQKTIAANIRLHIIFLILIIIINMGLFTFIIIYKSKITEIKSKTNINTSAINKNQDSIAKTQTDIEHKLLNIFSHTYNGVVHFSYILNTKKDIEIVKKNIIDYFGPKYNFKENQLEFFFMYQGVYDGDSFSKIKEGIEYSSQTLILLETEGDYKFGFYFEEQVLLDDDDRFENKNNTCFLFSFQREGRFNCIGDGNKIQIKKDKNGMLIIGDGDIIIKNHYLEGPEKKGVSNYPFKSFDISTINSNIFTGVTGDFDVFGMEIFTIGFHL